MVFFNVTWSMAWNVAIHVGVVFYFKAKKYTSISANPLEFETLLDHL
jgi:hypothetical protein